MRQNFTTTAPNDPWLVDITEHRTREGKFYLCAIEGVCSRRIVVCTLSELIKVRLAVDALYNTVARIGNATGCVADSDAGSQFTSIRDGERLAEIGAGPSIGTVGDSFDNALAETVNGYYKAELVRGLDHPGPWKTIEEL